MTYETKSLWDKAEQYIAGGCQTLSKHPSRYIDGIYPKILSHGEGCRVWDEEGKSYIDYICGLGPIILGYNNRYVNNAVKTFIENGKVCLSLPHSLESEVAEQLNKCIPTAEKVRFFKTGTEALMASVRLARGYIKKDVILVCGYHGWADWYTISTDKTFGVPKVLSNLTLKFKYNDLQDVEDKLKIGNVAAVVLEPVIYEEPLDGFLQGLRNLCNKYGVLLIFDEVVTGFRFGLSGAQGYFKVYPDISCFSKAMGNGFPISCVVGKTDIMAGFSRPDSLMSGTFGGDLVGLSAAKAVIDCLQYTINNKLYTLSVIWDSGNQLKEGFNKICSLLGLPARCVGYTPRTEFRFETLSHKALFWQECVKRGVLFGYSNFITSSHSTSHINETLNVVEDSLGIVKENYINPESKLEGKLPVNAVVR